MKRKYIITVALLAVLAVVFGLAGISGPLAESAFPQQSSSSSSDSVTHFANPPTYDSGWMNISDKVGQHFTLTHNLNTTEVLVDIAGKKSLVAEGGALAWGRTYGGASGDAYMKVIQTFDGGYGLVGYTDNAPNSYDYLLVKTDTAGNTLWSRTYGGVNMDIARSVVQTDDGGYAIAGYTMSFGVSGWDLWLVKTDSDGTVQWNQTYGGGNNDYVFSAVQTVDGGYALAGKTMSFSVSGYDYDYWLVKTTSAGTVEWNKTFGLLGDDCAYSVIQTDDGGYALAGEWWSPVHNSDVFGLIKTDSDGNEDWGQVYGGASPDIAYSVVETVDGGYALAGETMSFGAMLWDLWLVKTDGDGTVQWNQTYGGGSVDTAYAVVQTVDGGYALAGETNSFGVGGYDFWLVKTDGDGTVQWNQTYGGGNNDYGASLVQTSDGGYAIAGRTDTFGAGSTDCWLIKTEAEENLEHQMNLGGTGVIPGWNQYYGGIYDEWAYSMVQTTDGGYALVGYTHSFGAGGRDFWLVKTDSNGIQEWSRTYGGPNWQEAYAVVEAIDGGYAIAGETLSDAGSTHLWLVKTDAWGNVQWNLVRGADGHHELARSVVHTRDGGYILAGATDAYAPFVAFYDFMLVKVDAKGNIEWSEYYHREESDYAYSVIQTADKGYAVVGSTGPYGGEKDFWFIKTDSAGNEEWNQTYGGVGTDIAYAIVQTADGGYAIAGKSNSFGSSYDYWLIKTDSAGNEEWNQTYGEADDDEARSVIQTSNGGYTMSGGGFANLVETDESGNQRGARRNYHGRLADSLVETSDGGYALAGPSTYDFGVGGYDFWLAKTYVETGLVRTGLTTQALLLYRGRTDPYWNYVRVRIWTIQEPTWMFGDINQDGVVDAQDLYILSRNYGKTFSLLSLTGILAVAGIHQYQKRKHPT